MRRTIALVLTPPLHGHPRSAPRVPRRRPRALAKQTGDAPATAAVGGFELT
jgi:hypothetical protein